jgi:hypothetical protein
MNRAIDTRANLPPLPRGMYWLGDGKKTERAALTEGYEERLRVTNLVRLTRPGIAIHEGAKARLSMIERADLG